MKPDSVPPREASQRPGGPPTALRLLAAIGVVLLTAGLFFGGAAPVAVGLFRPPWDKVAHLLTFAVIGAAFGLASGARGWRMLLAVLTGALVVGAMDELHQLWLPGRDAGLDDFAADLAGGLLGAVLLAGAYRWLDRQRGRLAGFRRSNKSRISQKSSIRQKSLRNQKNQKYQKNQKISQISKGIQDNKTDKKSRPNKAAAL